VTVTLERSRIPLQVDVGYGDAVVPSTIDLDYPTLLGGSTPRIRAYPLETVVAEKVEAIVKIGMVNSRMKDYYDLWLIAGSFEFEGKVLTRAFEATFKRRGTALPTDDPIGLTREFSDARDSVTRWRAFIETNGLGDAPKELHVVVRSIRDFVLFPLHAAAAAKSFEQRWSSGEAWFEPMRAAISCR